MEIRNGAVDRRSVELTSRNINAQLDKYKLCMKSAYTIFTSLLVVLGGFLIEGPSSSLLKFVIEFFNRRGKRKEMHYSS